MGPTLAPTAAPTVIAHGSCPPGTYSAAWTSVGETCKAHTLTCSQGEFLQGASSVSKGSCATCPAGTYNDDASHRDSSCDFHGMCPPGQEPSNLSSKTSATQCSPCAPGTYSSSASSQEMCKAHTSCSATSARRRECHRCGIVHQQVPRPHHQPQRRSDQPQG